LRLIQADAAASTPGSRRAILQEEVARHLKTVAVPQRQRYLEALLTRFPVAGEVLKSAPPVLEKPDPAPPPPRSETIDETLERLIEAAGKVPAEKREEISKTLAQAGLVWVNRDDLVVELTENLRQKLGLQADQQPRLSRVVELTILLVDAFRLLDERALKTMKELKPNSKMLKRPEDFRAAAIKFLTSEIESLDPHLRASRGLLGGFLAAMLGGGKEFGRQFIERLSPNSIEEVVQAEGGFGMPWQPSKKDCCWEKYKALSVDFATADLIDRRVRDCLAAFIEKTAVSGA
jgi:hypothetical protein